MPRKFLIPILLLLAALSAGADPWSFAVVLDCRQKSKRAPGTYEGVLREIRGLSFNPEPKFPPIDFVVGAGDMMLTADDGYNWKLWLETFAGAEHKPWYLPVLGNHDAGDEKLIRRTILPSLKNAVGDDPEDYYADWKNVRVIVGTHLAKLERAIASAPASIDHIFIADHYPVFPRHAHIEEPGSRDIALWSVLLEHRERVRAYFCGHTHHYSRMRVANPRGLAATPDGFPDEEGGIYQIDSGNAGRPSHGEKKCTVVLVRVDGKDLTFRAIQAPHDTPDSFVLRDRWTLPASDSKPGK